MADHSDVFTRDEVLALVTEGLACRWGHDDWCAKLISNVSPLTECDCNRESEIADMAGRILDRSEPVTPRGFVPPMLTVGMRPSLSLIAHAAYTDARRRGFWQNGDPRYYVAEACAAMHGEVAEIYDAYRRGMNPEVRGIEADPEGRAKPIGIPSEVCDVLLLALEMTQHIGINVQAVLLDKMRYNALRPYLHGKRF